MSKTLYLIRHAKSSWEDPSIEDHDRPLNDRGKADAPKIGIELLDKKVSFDAVYCSTSKRTRQTFKKLNVDGKLFSGSPYYVEELYMADTEVLLKTVVNLQDEHNSVLIIGHNPGLTAFANMIQQNVRVSNIPTCGIIAVEFEVNDWKGINEKPGTFKWMTYPKKEKNYYT